MDKRSKLTLQNCLCSITPEWLKSILLEAPREHIGKLNIPQELKSKLQRDPKRILDLLKVILLILDSVVAIMCVQIKTDFTPHEHYIQEEGIMGRQHFREKRAVETALSEAWKIWTPQLEFQSTAKFNQRVSSHQSSSEGGDSVEDFAQLQQERLMATDDFDHQDNSLKDSLETNIIDLAVNEGMHVFTIVCVL